MKKIVFLGGKSIGSRCFDIVHGLAEANRLIISGVGCSPRGTNLLMKARDNGYRIIDSPDQIPPCDFILSVQYHKILKKNHLDKAKILPVNLHLAPLPEYRGCNQFSKAILNRDQEFGVTLHVMNTRIDNGDIIFESRFKIPKDIWVEDLVKMSYREGEKLLRDNFEKVIDGMFEPISQHDRIKDYGTSLTFRDDIEKLKLIDLDWPCSKIEKVLRATSMPGFSPPYTFVNNKKVFFRLDNDND